VDVVAPPGAVVVVIAPIVVLVTVPVVVLLPVAPPADVRQLLELPGWIVKGADDTVAPVESRRVSPRDVPDAMLATQVKEVPVCCPRSSMAAALGLPPGRMLRK